MITTGITVGSFALFVDLFLVGHTVGGEVWGPVTAIAATVAGLLSLVCLARRGGSRAARTALYLLWATVAFLGVAGYHDHRPPRLTDPITDQRERPPYAPLAFAGIAMAGAFALRRGSEGA